MCCVVLDSVSKKVKIVGKVKQGLSYSSHTSESHDNVQVQSKYSFVTCASGSLTQAFSATVDDITWHLRLGHAPRFILKHIPFLNCTKFTRSFSTSVIFMPSLSDSHAKLPFELLHTNILGPYEKYRYFLTLVTRG